MNTLWMPLRCLAASFRLNIKMQEVSHNHVGARNAIYTACTSCKNIPTALWAPGHYCLWLLCVQPAPPARPGGEVLPDHLPDPWIRAPSCALPRWAMSYSPPSCHGRACTGCPSSDHQKGPSLPFPRAGHPFTANSTQANRFDLSAVGCDLDSRCRTASYNCPRAVYNRGASASNSACSHDASKRPR